MGKNVLIFSDGTGNAGGLTFDEDRSNIYKLYRATRCGPDSCINPAEQIAFYGPGLGSPSDGGFMFGKAGRWLYNLVSQATGLGLTANIIDCYAALIRLYRDADRVFVFGFSRGAYTARSLAAVIAKCGIPRQMPGGGPVPLDVAGSRKLAEDAVKNVYQFCSSKLRKEPGSYRNFMLDTRELIAKRFRDEHGSSDPTDPDKANVYPYFIGVFDTVAVLGRIFGFILLLGLVSVAISFLSGFSNVRYIGWLLSHLTLERVFLVLACGSALLAAVAYVKNYVKFDFNVPGYGFWWSLATIHIAPRKQSFTDYSLNVNVEYAKHAISIDENRKDFKRVPWSPNASKAATRDPHGNLYFEQVWFAGSTSCTTERCTFVLLILAKAVTRASPSGVASSCVMAVFDCSTCLPGSGAPSKKNATGTRNIFDICCNRLAPIRFVPFSYFCTCWKVRPSPLASFSWLISSIKRRMRTRRPTWASIGFAEVLAIRRAPNCD